MNDAEKRVEKLRSRLSHLAVIGINAAIVDAYNEITRLQTEILELKHCLSVEQARHEETMQEAHRLKQDNQALAIAMADLKTKDAGLRFLDEAFNSGDGVYRP